MSGAKRLDSVRDITSVWAGSPEWSPSASPTWAERYDVGLHEAVGPEHPLVVASRNSTNGRTGAIAVADDLYAGAGLLAANHGFDIRPILPPKDFVVHAIMTKGMIVTSQDPSGRSFSNRFLAINLGSHGVVLSLSVGSAKKVNHDFEQPYVKWLERIAVGAGVEAGGFYFKRYDRAIREYWSQGAFIQRLRHLEASRPIWVGDGLKGRWDLDPRQDIIRFVEGTGSTQEADTLVSKKLTSQAELTGTVMTDFKVPYALHTACPPGTYRFHDPILKRWFMAIDSPELHPVGPLLGIPQVVDANGAPADQAGTMQWLLSELGKPGRGLRDLWPELIRRRYSTETLRLKNGQGPAAYYGGPSKQTSEGSWDHVASWSRSILDNLDFYETGTLVRTISPQSDPIEITNCFPPSGRWAEAEDFARIRRYLRGRSRVASRRTSWSWTGMPVKVNGVAGHMGTPRDAVATPVKWPIVLDSPLPAYDPAVRGAGFVPPIPDDELTKGIVNSLLAASGRPLLAAIADTSLNAEDAAVANELDVVSTQLGTLQRRAERQQDDLYAEDPTTGEPLMPSLVRIEMMRDLERVRGDIEELNVRHRDLRERLEALRVDGSGIDVDDLQLVLDGLHNARTNAYRERLGRAIRCVEFEIGALKRDRLRGRSVTFNGEIRLETATGLRSVPFGGAYELGAASESEQTMIDAVARLRAGDLPSTYRHGSRELVGVKMALEAFGSARTPVALRNCEDSALLRVGMAALFPTPLPAEDVALVPDVHMLADDDALTTDFGDVALLALRMQEVYATRRTSRWLEKDEAAMEVDTMIAAMGDRNLVPRPTQYTSKQLSGLRRRLKCDRYKWESWDWDGDAPRLSPCPHCGCAWLVPLRIYEVAGYLCLGCRRDAVGVRWPERFDRFVSQLESWRAVRAPISDHAGRSRPAPRPRHSQNRRLSTLSAEERQTILDDYSNLDERLASICQRHQVSTDTVMRLVREAGAPTRYGGTRRRWERRS